MTTLWIEPFGGMAGDMFLAALFDLGDARFVPEHLVALGERLVPGEFSIEAAPTKRGTIRAHRVDIRTPETAAEHPPHRHLSDLLGMLDDARLEEVGLGAASRERAGRVLRRIAEAEARVHGTSVEAVHFHEVGAVDTLLDVCGALLGLERLGVTRVVSTPPYVGGGTVRCAHGEMPVPAPGTAEILRGLPFLAGTGGERVTPTGAALLAELVDAFEAPAVLATDAVGYGAGAREPREGPPNLVRVSLVRTAVAGRGTAQVVQLECNLDDATGEEVGFLLSELRREGALEAWSVPVQMKKDRPGAVVTALARPGDRERLEAVCFAHSPTLGVRYRVLERTELARDEVEVTVAGRAVPVKVRRRDAPPTRLDVSPEHDALAELARASGRSVRDLEDEAIRAALALLRDAPGARD